MCECMQVCWDFLVITENSKWPVPNHHPSCKHYKTERFVRLFDDDGNSFIDTVENTNVFLTMIENSEEWKQEDIYLSQDQFEKLDEYKGF